MKDDRSYVLNNIHGLSKYIPGGLFRCLWDEPLTLLEVSESFEKLVGYTREEIRRLFNNSFRAMIDQRDWERVLEDVISQLAHGDEKEIEYRLKRKTGEIIWVLDKGRLITSPEGSQCFYCLLVDITSMRVAKEELRLSLERHQIITEQANDIIVEWDMETDILTFASNWQKRFPLQPSSGPIRIEDVRKLLYKQDIPAFDGLLKRLREGEAYGEAEARFYMSGAFRWCRIRLTLQKNDSGQAVKAIGVVLDVDVQKRREARLRDLAQRDQLTGLLNKATLHERIIAWLEEGGSGGKAALLMIDIDNFKNVNDQMGHLFGDDFLARIAQELLKLTREQDFLGRIGGDEFILFLKGLPEDAVRIAEERSRRILEAFGRIAAAMDLSGDVVSASIGIALYPDHGRSFQKLYQNADRALYQAKNSGKKQYQTYDSSLCLQKRPPALPSGMKRAAPERPIAGSVAAQLAEQAFDLLYNAKRIEEAIQTVLGMAGRQFSISRVYIFESSRNGQFARNTFEWCAEGIEPQIDHLQHISYRDDLGEDYTSLFNEDGIFYCRDIRELPERQRCILEPQGIKSMLQYAILENNQFQGLIGFDACEDYRYWTREQIDSLRYIAKIIHVFLIKHRLQERAAKAEKRLKSGSEWLTDERLQAVLRMRRSAAFEFDAGTGKEAHSPFLSEYVAGNYDERLLSQVMIEDNVIHPEDLPLSLRFREKLKNGEAGEAALRLLTPKGDYHWFRISLTPCPMVGPRFYVGVLADVDQEKKDRETLLYRAEYDPVSGVYNKTTFFERTQRLLLEEPDQPHYLARFDIDRFKLVNELYSTTEGDMLLRHIGGILRELVGPGETYGRLRDDVFGLCTSRPQNEVAALIGAIEKRINAYALPFQFILSAGIMRVDRYDGEPVSILCDRAALAQRTVKGSYIQRYALYKPAMSEALNREHVITGQMSAALKRGEFRILIQPKYDMRDHRVIGGEALVRWHRPDGEMMRPAEFIPLFERNGFIIRLDEYVWEMTCQTLRGWLDRGLRPVPLSVNVSRVHLHDPNFCGKLSALAKQYRIPPSLLELEITESAYIENAQTLYGVMEKLHAQGFSFSIDDFGSGYSSLNALKDIPADLVKIDLNFLQEARLGTEMGQQIIKGVIQLMKGISVPVIAEGVETQEQADFLMDVGCNSAQGFYFARPMPVEQFEHLLGLSGCGE